MKSSHTKFKFSRHVIQLHNVITYRQVFYHDFVYANCFDIILLKHYLKNTVMLMVPGTTVFLVIGKEIARKKLLLICCHRPTRIKFHAHLKNNLKKFHIT